MLDKARAFASGKLGEYIFPCPLDKRLLEFSGISADALVEEVKKGKNDTEMLAWFRQHLNPQRSPWEIEAWSRWLESMTPGDAQRHQHFAEGITELAPGRDDIHTTFERLDLDDYVSFGGRG
jgi:hypothetical protein